MNIRSWFSKKMATPVFPNDIILDSILESLSTALTGYFDMQASDIHELVTIKLEDNQLDTGDKFFLSWLKDKAMPKFSSITSYNLLGNETLGAQLDFIKYIIDSEIDETEELAFNKEIRTCIIEIVNSISEKITQAEYLTVALSYKKEGNNYYIAKEKGVCGDAGSNFLM